MMHFLKGDLLQADTEALVNTVNTVGVMGKGIALQFKEAFPHNNKEYVSACKQKELEPGRLLAVWDENLVQGRKLIINFPTKKHWRHPSKYEYIEKGLQALRALLTEQKVSSVAVPPLGCGNGGLQWPRVKSLIEQYLQGLDTEIQVYEPNEHIKQVLQKQEAKAVHHKKPGKPEELTTARALLLYALFMFEGQGEYSSLFAANKLAYFLQHMGQELQLQFVPYHYGPYALGVEKVLYRLNGTYLKGLEQGQAKPFEPLQLNYHKLEDVRAYLRKSLSQEEKARLKGLSQLMEGFTSELSLEILATVHFIYREHPSYQLDDIMQSISQWNLRKKELFKREYVEIAMEHLRTHSVLLS